MSSLNNTLLAALSEDARARLLKGGSRQDLAFGAGLYQPGDAVDWVYFPEGALLSLVRYTRDGQLTESGMVGYEGALGLPEACGSRVMASHVMVQAKGPAWRVPAEDCRTLAADGGPLMDAIMPAVEFQLIEARQSALCRSFHPAENRLARWLLESRERSGAEASMTMTQEFLAAMLGVRRTTVTAFAGELQQRDLIRYSRGVIEFKDPEGLEEVACECRQVLVEERARIWGPRSPRAAR